MIKHGERTLMVEQTTEVEWLVCDNCGHESEKNRILRPRKTKDWVIWQFEASYMDMPNHICPECAINFLEAFNEKSRSKD